MLLSVSTMSAQTNPSSFSGNTSMTSSATKDIAITLPIRNGSLHGTFSTFRVTNSHYMPLSQVSEYDITQFLFGARLESKGTLDIEPSDGAQLHISIEYNDNGSWTTVYSDYLEIESLAKNMRISKFRDLDNDGVISDDPTYGELSLIGIGEGAITTSVSSSTNVIAAGAITEVRSVADMGKVSFDHNELYLVSFSCANPNGLYENNLYNTYLPGGYEINYGLNAPYAAAIPSPSRIKTISSNNEEVSNVWNWIGFGAYIVPSIGLHLSQVAVAVENIAHESANFSIFPNPSSDIINVSLRFETATTAQIIITDISGRVVRLQTQKEAMNENLAFHIADLSAGVYFISVKTETDVSTQRFIKN